MNAINQIEDMKSKINTLLEMIANEPINNEQIKVLKCREEIIGILSGFLNSIKEENYTLDEYQDSFNNLLPLCIAIIDKCNCELKRDTEMLEELSAIYKQVNLPDNKEYKKLDYLEMQKRNCAETVSLLILNRYIVNVLLRIIDFDDLQTRIIAKEINKKKHPGKDVNDLNEIIYVSTN